MTSFWNRVIGKNLQLSPNSASKKAPTTSATPSSSLIPLDLQRWVPPEFNQDHVRLLVFSDNDSVGLELMFDSKTLRVVSTTDNDDDASKPPTSGRNRPNLPPIPPSSNPMAKPPPGPSGGGGSVGSRMRPAITRFSYAGKQYELLKYSNDIRSYADYIFGTMPLLFKGTGMKVHTSKSPLQIMMSRVFAIKSPDQPDTVFDSPMALESNPMPISPLSPIGLVQLNQSVGSNGSIASSTISSIDLLGEELTNQKFGRLYRRWLKCANRTMRQTKKQPGRRHRQCIGVAFIVTFPQHELSKYKHFEEFFGTHAPLIENHLQKIMNAAETNINQRDTIAATLLDRLFRFKDDLYTLYTRPRLQFPAWYLLTQDQLSMSRRRALSQQLCSVIDQFSTPKFGDFLNRSLSALLSYQLSWLSTVSPSLAKSKQHALFKRKAEYASSLQSFLQYSPLWGQLIDLFSAYAQPPYICRTVLVGSDPSLLNRLLYLLSFFIRPSYLTYKIPNATLSDTTDEQNRSYKKSRLYMDELIANAVEIQDIDSYSPVHSIHDDDENDVDQQFDDDDIDILSGDESVIANHQPSALTEPSDFYHLTFTSDDLESSSTDEQDISQLLDSLLKRIEHHLLLDQQRPAPSSAPSNERAPVVLSTAVEPAATTTAPMKTLMSLPLFEPQHLGHDPVPLAHDYHLDLALSLISSVGKTYSSDFVLQAIETSNVQEILPSILAQHAYDISEHGGLFLNEEHIDTSITIVINVDDLSVNLYSDKQKETGRRQERTTLIQPLIEHARFAKQQLPADFVLLNMEDSLQEIYFQALAILKYMRANNKSIYSRESVSSFGDSASTASVASGDTDDKQSMATNHTVTDLPTQTLMNPMSAVDYPSVSTTESSSELVQNVLKRFQLQRSDYTFLKNILRTLEVEQREMNA